MIPIVFGSSVACSVRLSEPSDAMMLKFIESRVSAMQIRTWFSYIPSLLVDSRHRFQTLHRPSREKNAIVATYQIQKPQTLPSASSLESPGLKRDNKKNPWLTWDKSKRKIKKASDGESGIWWLARLLLRGFSGCVSN